MEFYTPKKVIECDDFIGAAIENIKILNMKRPFLLFSRSGFSSERLAEFIERCEIERIEVIKFAMPKGEPTISLLNNATLECVDYGCDGVVAIGGGSAIDLAKGVAATAKDASQQFSEFSNYERINRFPLIAIPTTAGTGSEATKISVLIDERKKVKYNPAHPDLVPDVAILNAALTASVPQIITAETGLDALTHAFEAYVSTKANDFTDFYALEAIRLIHASIKSAYQNGEDMEARRRMLRGSLYAGLAFSNASTNLAHGTGRALGAKWHISHGLSVALMHPFVVKYSYQSAQQRYDRIAQLTGLSTGNQLSYYLMQLNNDLHIWREAKHLLDEDFEESIEEMAQNALNGNGILTNPRIPSKEQIIQLFKEMIEHVRAVHSIQS